ncbi:MAG: MerR family transcriptional regulator [Telluria sp.]
MPELTIGALARGAGVSRTTVLYYEKLGLIQPRGRSAGNYRCYGPQALERLRQVRAYRETGMSLAAIARLLAQGGRPNAIEERLEQIATEMARLQEQQRVLLQLLGAGARRERQMTKEGWTALLRKAGLDDAAMARWHALFERQAPLAHRAFLRSLGLDDAEVSRIRGWSRKISV